MDQENEASGNDKDSKQPRICLVIVAYQAVYSDPISLNAGETFKISKKVDYWNGNPAWEWIWCTDQRGKSGWVPRNCIDFNADEITGIARYNYAAIELTIAIGDELVVGREESGWLWCTNQQGRSGWVPLDNTSWYSSQEKRM